MASEIAWVAKLSCGHAIGSKPPAMADPDAPQDSVSADRQRAMAAYGGMVPPQARAAKPSEPAFRPLPDADQVVFCGKCDEGRYVVDTIENVDLPLPQLDKRRAGTRW